MDFKTRPLDYLIKNGFVLIKCKYRDKVPCEAWGDGVELRTRSADAFNGFNVAIKCGTLIDSQSYFYALDIDPRNGGDKGLLDLEEKYDRLPNTVEIATGGNGTHYYFKSKKKLKKCNLPGAVEFKGVGSIVIAPGSIHPSGRPYRVVENGGIAELPGWIEKMVGESAEETFPFETRANLKAKDVEIYPDGERDERLNQMAGYLRWCGLSYEEILVSLQAVNLNRCKPPKEMATQFLHSLP